MHPVLYSIINIYIYPSLKVELLDQVVIQLTQDKQEF